MSDSKNEFEINNETTTSRPGPAGAGRMRRSQGDIESCLKSNFRRNRHSAITWRVSALSPGARPTAATGAAVKSIPGWRTCRTPAGAGTRSAAPTQILRSPPENFRSGRVKTSVASTTEGPDGTAVRLPGGKICPSPRPGTAPRRPHRPIARDASITFQRGRPVSGLFGSEIAGLLHRRNGIQALAPAGQEQAFPANSRRAPPSREPR